MAKKYYDGDITLDTDWGGGDASTNYLPVVGGKVQKVIKESINSKVGYVGRVDKTGQGFYVLTRDEDTFNAYLETITEENPFGDLMMDGINGRFDAPFNYKMNITLLNPENGYKSTLVGSTGNMIKFTAETRDANDSPQGESLTITFKVITEGGVETSQTLIYDGKKASEGIEYNLDGKLGTGQNTVVITAVGMNTGISAMRRVTYRLIDMSFSDKFNITKRYQFAANGTLAMNIGYSLKGVGKTKILWYFDGNLYRTTQIANTNPNLPNGSEAFYFTDSADQWLKPGLHNLQMSMICQDTDSGEEFQTPIYYREFIIETTPATLETPFILRKTSFDAEKGFLANGEVPTIYNIKQFENVTLEYAAYYNGKSDCLVSTHVTYPGMEPIQVSSEKLPMEMESFSSLQKQIINVNEQGVAQIVLKAHYGTDEVFESGYKVEIGASDMNITTVTDSVALSLNAFGRSNNADDRESWVYTYLNEYGREETITTTFSKNEYVLVSTLNEAGEDVAPTDATDYNTIVVEEMPVDEVEDYKYVKFNNKYYTWTREFDWSNTSGWADNKLKLSKGNAITINYKPFSMDKLETLKERGGTYEFEFETTNVYNDDAVICRIAGNKNFAPGISIYASGAELVVSREVVEPEYDEDGELINTNAGYIKAVSTKYKAEESNRISFVITPDNDTNSDGTPYRDRILKIYVNGELCGAYPYDKGTNFLNDADITFRGGDDACINISTIQIYKRALSSNEILNNYIYFRNDTNEKTAIYRRNDIMLADNDEMFDSDKLKSQLPVMMFYQIDPNQSLDDIHQEKKNKKLTRFFDVVYINIQDPEKNFLVKNAYITPQGTSSMNYPVKNLRLYTGKKDKAGEYYSRLFVGSNIFIDGSPNNIDWDNINLDTEVKKKRQYSFVDGAIPVNCWCLKADYAESSSSHNTGTSRFWNNVLKSNGLATKAQTKAAKYKEEYPYDIRTAIDGFPIAVFYQSLDSSSPRFEGKYNFNNDKSTESVFGFTGGCEIETQEVKYYYIGNTKPIVHGEENDEGEWEWACEFVSGGYTETPTVDSPLYASKINEDGTEDWYMLRGIELLDNPKMECWELLNSVNEIALFKTMKGFGVGDDDEKVGIVDGDDFDEAFESRYPDCGDYFHTNSLKRFGEWLVSCRYLDVDSKTGESVPFARLPIENYHKNDDGKLSICSLTKQTGEFEFNFPDYNFYKEVSYDSIASNIKNEGYQLIEIKDEDVASLEYKEVDVVPTEKDTEYEYLMCGGFFYTWMPSNLLEVDEKPSVHESAYDYVKVGDIYYVWNNKYKFEDYHETQWVDDTAFNRALKFAIEKYDHIEMNKMAAYYIYLMRFGGVDQTVKNSMLTTEGPASDDPNSTLPSLWYFINYDNDTILGVKNDGRLVFDPYITRQTKDGTGYVYAGRESTLWNNLEADVQFMDKVTEIDNILAKGEADSMYALAYNNAIREYDTNQSDKWCERIYNKDAERKYVQTYVEGWTQKNDSAGTVTHVYEDYLYDVQGSRSAHRKWWLGRRFNVFDSRFCNTNFRNSLIKFRSTNLPAGSSFTIKSGEPIFYAWGHDNAVTEMTPKAIQPGDSYTFTTRSAFNIGSYLELMGSANISSLNLRDCVGALTELDVTGCYSYSVGTKMKEILVGDHTRTDLVNISNTSMKFSGLDKASKLEVLDMTNIKNAVAFDGLETLLNIREVYAKGTSVANFTFADGAIIEKIELPTTTETLSITRSSTIGYDNISFEDGKYGKLTNLTINECSQLMTDPNFVFNWLASKTPEQRANMSLNLQGINWKFDINNYNKLFLLETVGTSGLASRNIRGNIEITANLDVTSVVRLQKIFGNDCFKEGSTVYIKAPTALYVNMPDTIWEGSANVKCEIITVGTTLSGYLQLSAMVNEIVDGEIVQKVIGATNGVITMDETNLNRGYVLVDIDESNNVYEQFLIIATYRDETGFEKITPGSSLIKKRIYPNNAVISTLQDSYNNKTPNDVSLIYTPEEISDVNLEGRGIFSVKWEMIDGSSNYQNSVILLDSDKEVAKIQAPNGFDGTVQLQASVTRNYDSELLCTNTKEIEFTNPDTIITKFSNEPIYNILVSAGIIKEDETGFGKLTKTDAATLDMTRLVQNGKSIFAGHTEIVKFTEFQYFNNPYMGQMPQSGIERTLTPDGMFAGCSNLKEIAFSSNFAYTANEMFKGCTNLEHIYGPEVSTDEQGNPIYTTLSFVDIGDNFASGCTKLQTCMLSATAKYIGETAFAGCSSLNVFQVPTSPDLVIAHSQSSNPFQGCKNIVFNGYEYDGFYDGTSQAKYQVKDGACYELVQDSDRINLVHMGKDSLIANIPADKTVYASAYSMEYRTEKDIVVPSNVVFNGNRIFTQSNGDSITLTRLLGDSYCQYLFAETNYGKNYTFAAGETLIPDNCFANISNSKFTSLEIPEGITKIGASAFYSCTSLKEVTLPSTLVEIANQTFWLCKALKTLTFHSPMPPQINEGDFFNVMLDAIYVAPDYYNAYKEGIMHLIAPFVKPMRLYNNGYVRIVKDGSILMPDATNVVTVGGLTVTETGSDYLMYEVVDGTISDLNICLNGEVIGEVAEQYTTIYIGDNSSLFTDGYGYNFEIGVYDDAVKAELDANGWFYDARFKGIRSKIMSSSGQRTEITLTIPSAIYEDVPFVYGQYAYDEVYGYVANGGDNKLLEVKGAPGYNIETSILTRDGIFNIGFVKAGISTGTDGIIVNKLGTVEFTDPEMISTYDMRSRMTTTKTIEVDLKAAETIPANVCVTVTDGYAHTYRKMWKGETLIFNVPMGFDFTVSANDFVTSDGKEYRVQDTIVSDEGSYEIVYGSATGIELKNNILCYHAPYTDWYVYLPKQFGKWGNMGTEIPEVTNTEILVSDTDGLTNTRLLANYEAETIFTNALAFNGFERGIASYVPSYLELEMFRTHLDEINVFLLSNKKGEISLDDCWVSEAYDANNAWTGNGASLLKDTVHNYFIFGKRIIL